MLSLSFSKRFFASATASASGKKSSTAAMAGQAISSSSSSAGLPTSSSPLALKRMNTIKAVIGNTGVQSSAPGSVLGSVTSASMPPKKTVLDAVNTLYDEGNESDKVEHRHILSVLVDNSAGVLSKVSGLLAARGFNIDTVTVSSTDISDLSRMTIVLNCPESQIEQAQRQLEDLVEVWAVVDMTKRKLIERELLVIKIDCVPPIIRANTTTKNQAAKASLEAMIPAEMDTDDKDIETISAPKIENLHERYEKDMAMHFHRHSILEISQMFGGNVVDIGSEQLIIELVAPPKRIDAFMHLIRPFGIVEAARSGVIAIQRSKVDSSRARVEIAEKIDDLNLPPS